MVLGIGISVGRVFGGSAQLTASAQTFLDTTSSGALIANVSKPFGTGTTFSVVGTLPAQLALSGGTIVRGSSAPTPGTSYTIKVRATSSDGKREVAETLTFQAVQDTNIPANAGTLVGEPMTLNGEYLTLGQ